MKPQFRKPLYQSEMSRKIEKVSYAVFLTGIFAYFTYRIVKQNYSESEKKSMAIKELENKFMTLANDNIEKVKQFKMKIPQDEEINTNNEKLENLQYIPSFQDHLKKGGYDQMNLIKLQDFKRKVFVIGVYDDPLKAMVEISNKQSQDLNLFDKTFINGSDQYKLFYKNLIINNVNLIKNMMKEVRPESIVVEMCDERYDRWLADVVSHPNYEKTISEVHKILDSDPQQLLDYEQIDIEDSNLEYLLAIDYCSYRLPCKTILGDRNYKLTKKRFESKIKMLDVYKEALEMKNQISLKKNEKEKQNDNQQEKQNQTIFDLDKQNDGIMSYILPKSSQQSKEGESKSDTKKQSLGLENQVQQLKNAIEKVKLEQQKDIKENSKNLDRESEQLLNQLNNIAKVESQREEKDIYSEVVFDEINEQLIKSIQKAPGETILLLIRQERIKSLAKMWKDLNADFYQTQQNKNISQRLKSNLEASNSNL